MVEKKDKIVNKMMKLISNMNCSDSRCEDCFSKSHCCMCVGALELLYDEIIEPLQKQQKNCHKTCNMIWENAKIDACKEIVLRLRQFAVKIQSKVLTYHNEGRAVYSLFLEIDKILEDFINYYEK